MNIYPAAEGDMAAVAELEKELFSDPWSEEMLLACLNQAHYSVSVCADEEGKIIGYLISTHVAGEAELLRIGVLPLRQRQGAGTRLMDNFAKTCGERGTPSAFLEVRSSNIRAISLYGKYGFAPVGRRKNYYRHPAEDACLMAGQMTARDSCSCDGS